MSETLLESAPQPTNTVGSIVRAINTGIVAARNSTEHSPFVRSDIVSQVAGRQVGVMSDEHKYLDVTTSEIFGYGAGALARLESTGYMDGEDPAEMTALVTYDAGYIETLASLRGEDLDALKLKWGQRYGQESSVYIAPKELFTLDLRSRIAPRMSLSTDALNDIGDLESADNAQGCPVRGKLLRSMYSQYVSCVFKYQTSVI